MKTRALSRRTLLRGLGGIAIALPWLESMDVRAAGATYPTRFVALFSACGTVPGNFFPAGGTESSFTLPPILAPLEPHRAHLLIADGVRMESTYRGPGEGHMMGMGGWLTGTELQPGTLFSDGSGTPAGWGGGPSVDQAIAAGIGKTTAFKSLELGVTAAMDPRAPTVWDRMVYSGPGQPVPPECNPVAVFQRLFAGLAGGSAAALALRIAQRRSVLDYVQSDVASLQRQLGKKDQQKLEAHLTAIRDLESRLGAAGDTCTKPGTPPTLDYLNDKNYPQVTSLMLDLLAQALACDLTRVASLQWSYSRSSTYFTWLGITESHHGLSHAADTDATAQGKLTRIDAWYAQQVAGLLSRLAAIPEGDGTLLDHTLLLWGNELGKGNTHTRDRVPFVLAGGAGGAFRMGRCVQANGAFHNDLLVSCLNATGVAATTFGNPAYCHGPLPGLT